jgi:hypothetical protein
MCSTISCLFNVCWALEIIRLINKDYIWCTIEIKIWKKKEGKSRRRRGRRKWNFSLSISFAFLFASLTFSVGLSMACCISLAVVRCRSNRIILTIANRKLERACRFQKRRRERERERKESKKEREKESSRVKENRRQMTSSVYSFERMDDESATNQVHTNKVCDKTYSRSIVGFDWFTFS